jgi:phosphatidylserine/phosphatidylglycerophosphate/cardiolipin synthase-like enzyme
MCALFSPFIRLNELRIGCWLKKVKWISLVSFSKTIGAYNPELRRLTRMGKTGLLATGIVGLSLCGAAGVWRIEGAPQQRAAAKSAVVKPKTSSVTLIVEPDQGIQPVYDLLNSATKTIDMTMYELVDTKAEQILEQKAAKGVAVRVILDQNNEKARNQAAFTALSAKGVKVVWANPSYAVTHQKTITVDSATSAIMTLNMVTTDYPGTRDFAVMDTNALDVAAIEQTFAADFASKPVTPPVGSDLVWSPTNAQAALLGVINGAKKSLLVENEEMSDSNIVSALEKAAKNGVSVEVAMTNGMTGGQPTYKTEFDALKAAGVQVRTYANKSGVLYIHAKAIVADYGQTGAQAYAGSENFSSASLTKNRELGILTNDAQVMSGLEATIAKDFAGATPW